MGAPSHGSAPFLTTTGKQAGGTARWHATGLAARWRSAPVCRMSLQRPPHHISLPLPHLVRGPVLKPRRNEDALVPGVEGRMLLELWVVPPLTSARVRRADAGPTSGTTGRCHGRRSRRRPDAARTTPGVMAHRHGLSGEQRPPAPASRFRPGRALSDAWRPPDAARPVCSPPGQTAGCRRTHRAAARQPGNLRPALPGARPEPPGHRSLPCCPPASGGPGRHCRSGRRHSQTAG